MARTQFLASLASHMAVEIGDVIEPPGAGYSGKITSLDVRRNEIKIEVPAERPEGRLVTSIAGCGIVWMDEMFVKPRPLGAVNHSVASSS